VADLTLDRHILQEVIKKDLKPARRRQLALWIHERFQVSKKRSCGDSVASGNLLLPSRAKDQTVLRVRIRELAHSGRGLGMSASHLLRREVGGREKPCAQALRLEGLQVRMRVRRRKHISLH